MIITKEYAKRLIRQGKATKSSTLKTDGRGFVYIAITRHDKQRVDHYID